MSEIVHLKRVDPPPARHCINCKYYRSPDFFEPPTWARCRITGMNINRERQDYVEEISCGPEGRWFEERKPFWKRLFGR